MVWNIEERENTVCSYNLFHNYDDFLEPSKAPSNVVAIPQSKYSATVTWNPPPKSSWNGFIRKYEVKVEDLSFDAPAKSSCNEEYEVEVDGIYHYKMEYTISDLSPGTEYSVQVSAYTSAGLGKWSDPYKLTTHESGMFLTQSSFVDCT